MRVGYDASPVRPFQSGVGHYADSLLRALSTEYPQHEFLVLSHLALDASPPRNLIRTQRRAFPVKEIWMQLWLPRILARHGPDLCHFTNGISPLCMRSPYVVTVHDLSLVLHPEWHPWSRKIWMRKILKPSILRASGVLCDSEATRRDLLGWLEIPESVVRVAQLGVRPHFLAACGEREKKAARAKYGLERPFFFYLGNIEPRKNLRLLLDAFRDIDLQDAELVLAGRRAWLWRSVLGELERHPARRRVRLLDYVPETDLPALYQSARVFVYPSRMEGFGLPVLEAMASGLPVVTSRVEPLISLMGENGWLADPDDPAEWRAALRAAWEAGADRGDLAPRAMERAREFTWEKTARETMKLYEAALNGARNGS